ncbi:WecB/TagA/CpsF family glycosyltransferase [Prevotella salivae]|uniref:WecB/TagA/CpsF family glycosyltransferase n=1 Tax=Segatella salivae TaxID=228604 RepID=UPI001C5D2A4B|nr:WecB/TagA/CpsF family glycosyltransferase [Segatella salivae]MBW4905728.1 WecB/TagA/CpsF family glycosyltransferase [Segatella salivae]
MIVDKLIYSDIVQSKKMFEKNASIYTFLNPVSYLDAIKHQELFTQFDGIFADGGLLVKAIELFYGMTIQRRSFDMTSLAPLLFNYAQDNGKSIAIVASKQEYVERAVKTLTEKYPKLSIIYYRNGYFDNENDKIIAARKIVMMAPDYLIVGMGIIKQEDFLLKVKKTGFQGIGFTCGGFIHQVAADKVEYYPKWIDEYNLRFVYRMYKESHTRKRYLKAAFVFPFVFILERLNIHFKFLLS